jgi:hypothetical protein
VNSPAATHINDLGGEMLSQLELFFESYNRAHGRKFCRSEIDARPSDDMLFVVKLWIGQFAESGGTGGMTDPH